MIKGSCLCGAVKWNYLTPIESATACNCTACRRYGTLWAYGYLDNEIKIEGDTKGYKRTDQGVLGFRLLQTVSNNLRPIILCKSALLAHLS